MLGEYKNQKVTYNSKEMSLYEANQLQRRMERQIRTDKKSIAGFNGILTSNTKNSKLLKDTKNKLLNKQALLKEHNSVLNDFIKQTGNRKDNTRLAVGKVSILNKEVAKELEYKDVTEQYSTKRHYQIKKQKFFVNEDGARYNVDGRHVLLKTTQKEREIANILGQTFGGKVRLIPVVLKPKGIQTPDYIINNKRFDLKQIIGNGKNTLDTAINKKKKQSDNFIFDITKTEMSVEQALSQIEKIYKAKNRTWVNTILLIKDKKILKIFKRK